MINVAMSRKFGLSRVGLLLALVGACVAMLLSVGSKDAHAWTAENFCQNVVLGHLNGPNDSCAAGTFRYNQYVEGYGAQHSVCSSSSTNGQKSGVNASWGCSAGAGYSIVTPTNGTVPTVGIVRNNTTGDSVTIYGNQFFQP